MTMSDTYTGGFDVLLQVSETALNKQVANAFLTGDLFKPAQEFPVEFPVGRGVVAKGTAFVNFRTPVADVDQPRPRLRLSIRFSHSQLDITEPAAFATMLPGLGGTLELIADLTAHETAFTSNVGMDFRHGAQKPIVTFDDPTLDALNGLKPGLADTAKAWMEEAVLAELQKGTGRLDFAEIPVAAGGGDVASVEVTTINDPSDDRSFPSRDCVCLAMRMVESVGGDETGGRIERVTESLLRGTPSEGGGVAAISTDWLFAGLRKRAAAALEVPESSFDAPFHLNQSVPAPGGSGTLRRLNAEIEDGRIRLTGRVTKSGDGYEVVSDFGAYISFELEGGELVARVISPTLNTTTHLDPLAWLVVTLASLLGLGGAIVSTVLLMFVEALVDAEADAEAATAFKSFDVDSLVSGISLGPLGTFFTPEEVELDDLVLRGRPTITLPALTRNTGTHTASAGFTLDLDSGTIATTTRPATDLIWDSDDGLSTNGAAGMSIFPGSFGDLDLYTISTLPLDVHAISHAGIPISTLDLNALGTAGFNPLVLGVQTTGGRYSAVQIVAFLDQPLQISWRTYDHPIPELSIAAAWSVVAEGPAIPVKQIPWCNDFEVRWGGTFEARPKLMASPIDYRWCLCGTVLDTERGTVRTGQGNLDYAIFDGHRLSISTEEIGQDIECELCLSAIDARGQELFTCIQLSLDGLDRRCQPNPRPPRVPPTVVRIPPGPEFGTWRPLKTAVRGLK